MDRTEENRYLEKETLGELFKLECLPKNRDEAGLWMSRLLESKIIKSKVEYIIQNSNKTYADISKYAAECIEVRYGLRDFDKSVIEKRLSPIKMKEKCLDILSKTGCNFEFIKSFDNKFLKHISTDVGEIEMFHHVLAGIWDVLLSNFEEILESKLKHINVFEFPVCMTNNVLVLELFLKNFATMNKYTQFFNSSWWPNSMTYFKSHAVIALTECKRKGIYEAIQNEEVKGIVDEFVCRFIKNRNSKVYTFSNGIMPKTYGTYDELGKMLDDIVIPWIDESMFNENNKTYVIKNTGHVLTYLGV